MSGGTFDYDQYRIDEIANRIEEEIEEARKPKPPKKMFHSVNIVMQTGEHSYTYPFIMYQEFKTVEEAKHFLRLHAIAKEVDGHFFASKREAWKDDNGKEHIPEYQIRESDYEDYEDGNYYKEYSEKTLKKFEYAVKLLRKAAIYAHRIDWLIAGDDGEDTFHKCLKEDLEKAKLEKRNSFC